MSLIDVCFKGRRVVQGRRVRHVTSVPDPGRRAVHVRQIVRLYPILGICSSHTRSSKAPLPEVSHFPRLLI